MPKNYVDVEEAVAAFLRQQHGNAVRFTLHRLFFYSLDGPTKYRAEAAKRMVWQAIRAHGGIRAVFFRVLEAAWRNGWYGMVVSTRKRAYVQLYRLSAPRQYARAGTA